MLSWGQHSSLQILQTKIWVKEHLHCPENISHVLIHNGSPAGLSSVTAVRRLLGPHFLDPGFLGLSVFFCPSYRASVFKTVSHCLLFFFHLFPPLVLFVYFYFANLLIYLRGVSFSRDTSKIIIVIISQHNTSQKWQTHSSHYQWWKLGTLLLK